MPDLNEVWRSLIWATALVLVVGIIMGGAYIRSAHQDKILLMEGYQERQIGQRCTPVTGWTK